MGQDLHNWSVITEKEMTNEPRQKSEKAVHVFSIMTPQKIMKALKTLATGKTGSSINELRLILALESAVARIESHKKLSEHFVFKGGFALLKTINTSRFTRDVDALAIGLSRKKDPVCSCQS